MRISRLMLQGLFLILIINLSKSETRAQGKAQLPPELNQNSSPAEILAWLDQASFANARVGLNRPGAKTRYSNGAVISRGESLAKVVFSSGRLDWTAVI